MKGAEMWFMKPCDQYLYKFNFGHFFSFLRALSLCLGGDDKNFGESFGWETLIKMTRFSFLTPKSEISPPNMLE